METGVTICDEYLAFAALTDNLPQEIGHDQIAVTPTAYGRLLRGLYSHGHPEQSSTGRLSRLVQQMSPESQAKLLEPDPRILAILDSRPFLNSTARISVECGLSWMAAEMAAAAIHHRVGLSYGIAKNIPPKMHTLLSTEGLLGIRLVDVTSA